MNRNFQYGLLILASVILSCERTEEAPGTRYNLNLNDYWTFNYLPGHELMEEITQPKYDDAQWPAISVPHTWQTYETTREEHPFIYSPSERDDPYWWKGWGYYRKKIHVKKLLDGKRLELEFDGVQKYCRIYINGQYAGEHKGGFNSFYLDITPFVDYGKDNVIVVAVSNRRDDVYRIPPMTAGNWNVYGGIYRDVRLVVKNRLYIPFQGSWKHEGGTFITTPYVDSLKAITDIRTWVQNDYDKPRECLLISEIISPSGDTIEIMESRANIDPGELFMFEQTSGEIMDPELWHPDHPSLYKVISKVYDNGVISDQYESPLGFRWFLWDYTDNDLYVNGKKLDIKGINRHQEYPWLGDAIPKWITFEDLLDIRDNLGHNFMRAAHYPNDGYLYDLADSLGMIMVEEVPNIKAIDFSEEVQEQNLREMIRRDRNHPSIFFWSMGNETTDAADSKWAVEEDTTRILHVRKGEGAGDFVQHDATNLDMEHLLRVTIPGWYDREHSPADRPVEPVNGQQASTEEWQHRMAVTRDRSVRGLLGDNCVGWLYEDHGCDREYRNSPILHLNYKGWVDIYRKPKYIYYLTKAFYTDTPTVHAHYHGWSRENIGKWINITVNSNCDTVELFGGSKSYGKRVPLPDSFYIEDFQDVLVEDAPLRVIGRKDGVSYEHRVEMAGPAAAVRLTGKSLKIPASRAAVSVITADITDVKGNPLPYAVNTLEWHVEGPAKLITPARYASDILKLEEREGSGYTTTPVSTLIRSTGEHGIITVKVSSDGLEGSEIVIEAVECEDEDETYIVQYDPGTAGRSSVQKGEVTSSLPVVREEMKPITGNHAFIADRENDYAGQITAFILKHNPEIIPERYEFKILVNWFDVYLQRMKGQLIGDDYNVKANQYNDARYISSIIDYKNMHSTVGSALSVEYAERIIIRGESIDMEETTQRFEALPKSRRILWIENINARPGKATISGQQIQEMYYATAYDLSEFTTLAYPEFSAMGQDEKEDYLRFVELFNSTVELVNGQYRIKTGSPVMFPDPAIAQIR